MIPEYWQRQDNSAPLFPDILWSRPENRATSGKLLVIGGNAQGFAAVGEAYQSAVEAGIGTVKIVMPSILQKTVGVVMEDAEYAASTPSGSFAKQALPELLDLAQWSDGVLIAGDLGRNSETAVLLEQFISKYRGQLTITKDAIEYLHTNPKAILLRDQTSLVLSLSQLQRLGTDAKFHKPFLLSMGLMLLAGNLHDFTTEYGVHIVTKEQETLVVASNGKISSTKTEQKEDIWRVKTAARTSTFWLQNPSKPFEAMTSSLSEIRNK